MLLYGLVACPLNKSQLLSIDFVINRFFKNKTIQYKQHGSNKMFAKSSLVV